MAALANFSGVWTRPWRRCFKAYRAVVEFPDEGVDSCAGISPSCPFSSTSSSSDDEDGPLYSHADDEQESERKPDSIENTQSGELAHNSHSEGQESSDEDEDAADDDEDDEQREMRLKAARERAEKKEKEKLAKKEKASLDAQLDDLDDILNELGIEAPSTADPNDNT